MLEGAHCPRAVHALKAKTLSELKEVMNLMTGEVVDGVQLQSLTAQLGCGHLQEPLATAVINLIGGAPSDATPAEGCTIT